MMKRREIEATVLFSLAVLVVAMLLALAARKNEKGVQLGPGPAPP
jgi:hypothetical protein